MLQMIKLVLFLKNLFFTARENCTEHKHGYILSTFLHCLENYQNSKKLHNFELSI